MSYKMVKLFVFSIFLQKFVYLPGYETNVLAQNTEYNPTPPLT